MQRFLIALALAASSTLASAGIIVTRDAATIAAFQNGATVLDFDGDAPYGRTPQAIGSYAPGQAVDPGAFLFDQASGVKFTVGGMVGVNAPAIYRLEGTIAGDAHSGSNVLGTVSLDGETNFGPNAFMEVFFPTQVSRVGFWVNQQLDFVTLIAQNTIFAFSFEDEAILEDGVGDAGFFVGIERDSADIGGFKILARGAEGFTIDDFTFGGMAGAPVPEPGSLALVAAGLVALRRRRSAPSAAGGVLSLYRRKSLAALAAATALLAPTPSFAAPATPSATALMVEAQQAYYQGHYGHSLALFERLAAQRDAEAADCAGFMLLQGSGLYGPQVRQDLPRATALLQQAAQAGRPGAGFLLNMLQRTD